MATGNIGTGNTLTLATFTAMKRLALLPLLALAAAPCFAQDPATNAPAADDTFVSRAYVLPYDSGCWTPKEIQEKENSSEGWRQFLSELGVEWPEGSSIRRSLHLGSWIVRNTEENHLRIREILRPLDGGPALQVRVQTHFCAFTPAAFEALELSETVGTMLSPDAWKALRKRIVATEGAEVLGCPAMLLQTGAQGTAKTDVEYIFPTEFDVEMLESAATAADTNAPAQFVAAAVEPQNFQTREVGQVLDVTPRVSSDGTCISLDLAPFLVLPPTWRNYGSPVLDGAADPVKPELEQPFFPVAYVATSVDIRSGYTVALGGGALDEPVAGRRFHVFFVTASLVEMEPPIVSEPDL